MSDHSESLRSALVSRLYDLIPQEHLQTVLSVLDAALADYEITRKSVDLIPYGGTPEVVKIYIASKSVENLSMGTLKIYRLRLEDFFRMTRKSYQDIRANDIRLYLHYYKTERKASGAYLDTIRRILNSFFVWLVANDYVVKNPCTNVDKVKYQAPEREPLSSIDLETLRWSCKSVREKALVDFLYSTGVRVSECHSINLSDINWEKRSVIIQHGKGDKRRTVFFNAEAEISLKKYLDTRNDGNDALFVSGRSPHNRLSVKSIESIISAIAKRCNMHVYPHKLRHTFATDGINGGMSLEQLQALMGHANPETTLIYAKIDHTDLQLAHRRTYS